MFSIVGLPKSGGFFPSSHLNLSLLAESQRRKYCTPLSFAMFSYMFCLMCSESKLIPTGVGVNVE